MPSESPDSNIFGEAHRGQRRRSQATTVYVVNPSELAQLGWYHSLYQTEDLLLIGTGSCTTDARDAIAQGWADLVLIDLSIDGQSGFGLERELLNTPIRASYLFTSDSERPGGAAHSGYGQTIAGGLPTLHTRGAISLLVEDLRAAVQVLGNPNQPKHNFCQGEK